MMLRALELPAFVRYAEEIAQKAEREGWTFGQYLHHLAELEVHERRRRRTERFLENSDLPREKPLSTLNRTRLPPKGRQDAADALREQLHRARRQPPGLRPPRSWQDAPRVRDRLRADPAWPPRAVHADLRLVQRPLDGFDAAILDDVGYVQQSRDEMEVLFTFLAERTSAAA